MAETIESRVLVRPTVRHLVLNGLPIACVAILVGAMLVSSHWITPLLWVGAFLLVVFVQRFFLYLFLVPAVRRNRWVEQRAQVFSDRRYGTGYPRSQLFFCSGSTPPVVYKSYSAFVEPELLGEEISFLVGVPGRRFKAVYRHDFGGPQVVRRLSRHTAARKRALYST
jgi:hypothetical protein